MYVRRYNVVCTLSACEIQQPTSNETSRPLLLLKGTRYVVCTCIHRYVEVYSEAYSMVAAGEEQHVRHA